jgi:acetylornithine/succinyldiaminopimelate/putrescine aminotransferase
MGCSEHVPKSTVHGTTYIDIVLALNVMYLGHAHNIRRTRDTRTTHCTRNAYMGCVRTTRKYQLCRKSRKTNDAGTTA